jgi:peptidoglycan/xylan/chitin deacetylase (PgdA/CDA1 family)
MSTPTPVPILLYHSISESRAGRYARFALSPSLFAEHMAYLADTGCSPMTVSTFVSRCLNGRLPLPARPVVLTFDDGLKDFATGALPVLAKHRFPATLFVTAGYVGRSARWLEPLGEGRRAMLTWADLRELADAQIEIGGHGYTHVELDILNAEAMTHEIRVCKELIELGLQRPVRSFSYPHGYSNSIVRELVRRHGFESACAVGQALSSTSDDPFRLARFAVAGDTSVESLARVLSCESLHLHTWPERARVRGWRLARRARMRLASARAPIALGDDSQLAAWPLEPSRARR